MFCILYKKKCTTITLSKFVKIKIAMLPILRTRTKKSYFTNKKLVGPILLSTYMRIYNL